MFPTTYGQTKWITMPLIVGMQRLNVLIGGSSVLELLTDLHMTCVPTRSMYDARPQDVAVAATEGGAAGAGRRGGWRRASGPWRRRGALPRDVLQLLCRAMSASSSLLPIVMALGVDMDGSRGWQQHRTPSRKMSRTGHGQVAADSPTHWRLVATFPVIRSRSGPLTCLCYCTMMVSVCM